MEGFCTEISESLSMLVVGLTGGLATGKTTVAHCFLECGAQIIDADMMTHELLARQGACYAPIVKDFGEAILTKENEIDRRRLAAIVFEDEGRLRQLESIIHPVVIAAIGARIKELKVAGDCDVVICDVPLLFEVGLETICDMTVVVQASPEMQIQRAQAKFGLTQAEAVRRIEFQMSIDEKCRRADFIINNKQDLNELKEQVKELWEKILKKIK